MISILRRCQLAKCRQKSVYKLSALAKNHFVFVLITASFLMPGSSKAQIAVQNFETPAATPTWAIAAGSANISTTTGTGDTPPSQRLRSGSARSWQVNNGTATLDLSSVSL
jgi:hypothetical protein